jgi:(S)-2-hydroxyglutarate dehydrogenase
MDNWAQVFIIKACIILLIMSKQYSTIVIGGGIVGLAACRELILRDPKARLLLLEKESELATHQTGRNSGVIHSGLYYRPGSLKASLCVRGNKSMYQFCNEHGVPFERTGKLVVAKHDNEVQALKVLQGRAKDNGIIAELLDPQGARLHEPEVRCVAALYIPSTGITDYGIVAATLGEILLRHGAEIVLESEVTACRRTPAGYVVESTTGSYKARSVLVCAGLQSDRLVQRAGMELEIRIVPFRGEYYDIVQARSHLVRNLIYPVPNPALPFLGVHLTRNVHGHVHAGPNAVFAFRREGYSRLSFSLRDTLDTLTWPGFAKVARKFLGVGIVEQVRSLSKSRFAHDVRQLVPAIQDEDLVPGTAGVRAQAISRDGALVDDFVFMQKDQLLHVCNAPSPAATASLEIARVIVDRLQN